VSCTGSLLPPMPLISLAGAALATNNTVDLTLTGHLLNAERIDTW
jgi:hypothetical protein